MDYITESDLQADGFIVTPNVFHTGKGNGKIYEKIVHHEDSDPTRVFFSVDTEGVVAPWALKTVVSETDGPKVVDVVAPAPEAQAVAPEAQDAGAESEATKDETTNDNTSDSSSTVVEQNAPEAQD